MDELLDDDEARELCRRVLAAQTPEEFNRAISELRIALRDHFTRTENLATQKFLRLQSLTKPKTKTEA
jgi:hypothetical protein